MKKYTPFRVFISRNHKLYQLFMFLRKLKLVWVFPCDDKKNITIIRK